MRSSLSGAWNLYRLDRDSFSEMTLNHRPPQNRLSPSDVGDLPSPECREVVASLWDYLDGNCSSELAERIDAHISSCASCLRFRQAQETFFEALAEVRERSPAPRHLHDRVRQALAAERRRRE
jgi:mycothiol system anti-sigma-R factor